MTFKDFDKKIMDIPIKGHNPLTGEVRQSVRHRLLINYELPIGDEYRKMLIEKTK